MLKGSKSINLNFLVLEWHKVAKLIFETNESQFKGKISYYKLLFCSDMQAVLFLCAITKYLIFKNYLMQIGNGSMVV